MDLGGQLAAARERIAELERRLEAQRTRDPLTGLLLLNPFLQRVGPEIERSKRHGRPLVLAVVDIDGFRSINVHHGRATGDQVLAATAKALTALTRATDLSSRSGPDEFVILMPETDIAGGLQVLERMLIELEALRVGRVESIPVSAGLAQWERPMDAERLLELAIDRLRVARANGGGRAECAGSGASSTDDESQSGRRDVVAALAEALLERDRYTGEHSESVVALVERVARGLALSGPETNNVKAAALLHDIGKVAIPDQILNKDGPLDETQWRIMREHPVIGERILRAIPGMGAIARIVRHEHERFDGTGYPDGIAGDDIPIGARIILACDAYHAMTSDRPYRQAMPHGEALRELAAGAGTQFDPAVTEVLIGCLYGDRHTGGDAPRPTTTAAAA
jgi:diguanylate cyclase (GGDEF)-like protein/putative nucleotidyltransferase with HDIG domain